MVGLGDVLGQPHRVVERDDDHRGADPDAGGALADGGGQHQRVGDGAVVGEVVLGQQHAVVPEPLGELRVVHEVAVDLLEAGPGVGALADQEGPDPHRSPS